MHNFEVMFLAVASMVIACYCQVRQREAGKKTHVTEQSVDVGGLNKNRASARNVIAIQHFWRNSFIAIVYPCARMTHVKKIVLKVT